MKLKPIVAAVLLATVAAAANADYATTFEGSTLPSESIFYEASSFSGFGGVVGDITSFAVYSYSSTGLGSLLQTGIVSPVGAILSPYTFAAGLYAVVATGTGPYKGFYTTMTSAVPEPETYAMMLAGLGVMGFVAARRKG